jgi:hypothetical protein
MIAFSLLVLAFLLFSSVLVFIAWLVLVNKFNLSDDALMFTVLVTACCFLPIYGTLGYEVYKKAIELDNQRISVKE